MRMAGMISVTRSPCFEAAGARATLSVTVSRSVISGVMRQFPAHTGEPAAKAMTAAALRRMVFVLPRMMSGHFSNRGLRGFLDFGLCAHLPGIRAEGCGHDDDDGSLLPSFRARPAHRRNTVTLRKYEPRY